MNTHRDIVPPPTATPSPWLVWQLVDSAFPAGGFAHSGGLEAARQHGEVRDRIELETFLANNLRQLRWNFLPLVVAGHDEPERLAEWDSLADAFLNNHVANRASRLQGTALQTAAERIFGEALFTASRRCAEAHGHLAPLAGFIFRQLSLERSEALGLASFWQLRGWVASAVRLGIVGPLEAQAIQHRLGPLGRDVAASAEAATADDLAQTAPLFDLWQGAQDRLYSRLFQS